MTDLSPMQISALPGPDDIHRVELENGITVLARYNPSSPAVVVDGTVYGGAIWEPVEKAGLATFTSRMLTRGTADYTFSELFEEIESNGASLEVSNAYHTFNLSSKSLAEDLPLMLRLLSQVLRYPTFPAEYVERVRGQLLTQIQVRQQNTRAMAAQRFRELAYPEGHPYTRSTIGYAETVPGITRDDLVSFHQQLGPQDMIMVVVGAIQPEEAITLVREAFGDWENPNQRAKPALDPAPRLTQTHEDHVPIPGKTQSDIVLGYPGPPRRAEDYQAARMANSILGVFGMYGRLGDSVREEQGLAYYSYSRMRGGLGPSPWRVVAGVAPENVTRAVESIRTEIRRMVEEPVSGEELSDNKSYLTGSIVLGLETNEGVAGSMLSMEMYDLGLDYLQNYADMINAITVEDVQQAAQRYLDPDAYALAVAGPGG